MNIHCLQHVDFEGPAAITEWALTNGHTLSFTHFYKDEPLPSKLNFDLLVVMGGPMSFDEDDKYAWMPLEKVFIKNCIEAGKSAIGICLGAQFIAQALGAKAKHGTSQEIGWYPITFQNQSKSFDFLPESTTVFHWHGDTFDIPQNAIHIASTEAFPNQGFIWNNKVVGLQFHLEVTEESVLGMIEHVGHEIGDGEFCQPSSEIVRDKSQYVRNKTFIFKILDQITD